MSKRVRRLSSDRRSGIDTRSEESKFMQGERRFSFPFANTNGISASNGSAVADRKIRKKNADKRYSNVRTGRDRRSGIDIRSEETKFMQGERRSGGDRRLGPEHRYRSFKKARAFVRDLGLRSAKEWRDYNKSGNRPDDIPVAPHHIYANDGWAGWGDWLGASAAATYFSRYQTFTKARAFVRSLGLKSGTAWKDYCKSGKKPADIPAKPEQGYANDGWTGMGDWLGYARTR